MALRPQVQMSRSRYIYHVITHVAVSPVVFKLECLGGLSLLWSLRLSVVKRLALTFCIP
jgi:hypothetical protein